MRARRLITLIAAALLAGAIAAGVSYATIPGPGNVYSACMLKGVGTIRLIDKSLPDSNLMSRCKTSLETEVSWNQAGQQGAAGPAGRRAERCRRHATERRRGRRQRHQRARAGGRQLRPRRLEVHGRERHHVRLQRRAREQAAAGGAWAATRARTRVPTILGTSDNQPLELRVNGVRSAPHRGAWPTRRT